MTPLESVIASPLFAPVLAKGHKGLRGGSGVWASSGTEGREGNHVGLGTGRRERTTLAASCGPPYQQPRGQIQKASANLHHEAEMVQGRLATVNKDCPSQLFLLCL